MEYLEYLRTSRECIKNRIGKCAPKNDIVAKMHSRFVIFHFKIEVATHFHQSLQRRVGRLECDSLNDVP